MNLRNVLNAVLFQAAWFAAVLGAARGMPWLGPLALVPVLAVHLLLCADRRGEVCLLLSAGAAGFLFDSAMTAAGAFVPRTWLAPPPLSPPWMVGLWLNLAATLNYSLGWLRGRPLLAACFGAVGGPLAYYSGARLGATHEVPSPGALLMLAVGWGVMTPFLAWLARKLSAPEPRRSGGA